MRRGLARRTGPDADFARAEIAFDQARYREAAAQSGAACLVVPDNWQPPADGGPANVLYVADVNRAMARIAEVLCPPLPMPAAGVHPKAAVAESARLGRDVHVGACAVVGEGAVVGDRTRIRAGAVVGNEAVIGADCDIHSGVVIRERCRLGNRVIVHAGAVIGSDGFGYLAGEAGPEKIPQLGTVEVGDDVEIGAGTTVDRARFGATQIVRDLAPKPGAQVLASIGGRPAVISQTIGKGRVIE